MESNNFRITVDLSNFFKDYRSRVKFFIGENVKTIKDIENKLITLFEIDKFHLTSGNEYLPPSEDVRILGPNEVINAIPTETVCPVSEKKSSKTSRKRKLYNIEENSNESINFHNYSAKKRKNISPVKECVDIESTASVLCASSSGTTVKSKKKKKKKKKKESNLDDSSPIDEHKQDSPESVKLNSSGEYTCKGDLISYVKKSPVPTNTHEYLIEKKVNIVRIDVVNTSPSQPAIEFSQSENENVEHPEIKSAENISQMILEKTEDAENNVEASASSQIKSKDGNNPEIIDKGLISAGDDESSIHKSISAISGLQDIPSSSTSCFLKPAPLPSLGYVAAEHKSQMEHSSSYSTLEESECSQFITKRKRKRIRKRQKRTKEQNITAETPISGTPNTSEISLNTKSCPSIHIRFEYNTENDDVKIINLKEKNVAKDEIETINISDNEASMFTETAILKAPVMGEMFPKVGDIVAFKTLRLGQDYSPVISSFITGRVIGIEGDYIDFDIISGIDQCEVPSGKFTIGETENDKDVPKNTQFSFKWENLYCTRLLQH